MTKTFPLADVIVMTDDPEVLTEKELAVLQPSEDPFRILILGDFSGRSLPARRPIRIDRRNLDGVLQTLHPWLNLFMGTAGRPLSLEFEDLADFQPDRIFQRCRLMQEFDEIAHSSATAAAHGAPPQTSSLQADELQSLIDELTGPGVIQHEETDSVQACASRELRVCALVRAILHHPDFQALESAWRSLSFLVHRLDTDELLKLYILDISKEKLLTDLVKAERFRSSDVYRAVVEDTVQNPLQEPWAVIIGNYGFDRSNTEDVELLERMGLLGRAAGAPFLAECVPSHSQTEVSDAWRALRESSHAPWLGLALPRMLLRLPYGKSATAVEGFDFEEMPGEPKREEYLWGNPCFGCAYLLGKLFSEYGWHWGLVATLEIHGLPVHSYQIGGETRTQPPLEILLTDDDSGALMTQGLMVLKSNKSHGSVWLSELQSISEPPQRLSGRWNGE
jgi:type VI secretion system protein ImpC